MCEDDSLFLEDAEAFPGVVLWNKFLLVAKK
jgi:hypothetical protein